MKSFQIRQFSVNTFFMSGARQKLILESFQLWLVLIFLDRTFAFEPKTGYFQKLETLLKMLRSLKKMFLWKCDIILEK